MKIIKTENGKSLALKTKEISSDKISSLGGSIVKEILHLLKNDPLYPKQIAKKLKLHEQKIYYYIHKLEKAGIIKVVKQERMQGTIAKFYALSSDSFYFKVGDFKESSKIDEKESNFFKPFIDRGELNALIVVGSPDPHGPQKARSKDGYFGMDFALFLGTFLSRIDGSRVKLDTEIREKDLEENNLIVIGGPIVNRVSEMIGKRMPIYFDENKKGFYSEITKKIYVHDEIGVINKCANPFNRKKSLLFVAGIRNSGTKAAIISFLRKFNDIENGNMDDTEIKSKVVEGIDLDSDGIIDDVEIVE